MHFRDRKKSRCVYAFKLDLCHFCSYAPRGRLLVVLSRGVDDGDVQVMCRLDRVMSWNSNRYRRRIIARRPLTHKPSHHPISLLAFQNSILPGAMPDSVPEHVISKFRYEALFGAWLLVTGGVFLRISRQPYSSRLKIEQYESIFKGTSMGAVLLGIGMTPGRSTARRFRPN